MHNVQNTRHEAASRVSSRSHIHIVTKLAASGPISGY